MYGEINNIKIGGIATAVANNWNSLEKLSNEKEEFIRNFIKNTGVKGRY